MMLYIDASSVDMTKAVRDYTPVPPSSVLRLTRQRGRAGTYSSTGIWGDPTFASATKGRMLVEALVAGILDDITQLRTAPLPARSNTPPQTQNTNRPANQPPVPQSPGIECTPGDFRDIRAVGEAFTSAWNQKDPLRLASLWTDRGNIIHPDGVVETNRTVIEQNRRRLFYTREYRSSYHLLQLTLLKCLSADIALADGKWELTGVVDPANKPVPKREGQVTLVVTRTGSNPWAIEAYRYTIK